jgi:hypothetical protein
MTSKAGIILDACAALAACRATSATDFVVVVVCATE